MRGVWVSAPNGVTGSDAHLYLIKFHKALMVAGAKKAVSDGNPRMIGGLVPPKVWTIVQCHPLPNRSDVRLSPCFIAGQN